MTPARISYTLAGLLLVWAIVVLGILGAPILWVAIAGGAAVVLKAWVVYLGDCRRWAELTKEQANEEEV